VTSFEFRDELDISKNWNVRALRLWRNHDASFLCFDSIPECDRQTDGHLFSGYTSACIAYYSTRWQKSTAVRWLAFLMPAVSIVLKDGSNELLFTVLFHWSAPLFQWRCCSHWPGSRPVLVPSIWCNVNTNKINVPPHINKKAQLTQGLRATAPSFQDGGCTKTAVSRHLGYYRTGNSAIRSADHENPCLEPDMEWIGCTVCEIFAFKFKGEYLANCDLETGVRSHWRSLKVAPWDRPTPKTSYWNQTSRRLAKRLQSYGHFCISKMAVSRHLGFYRTTNSAIRSVDPETPSLEQNMEWIGCTVCEIFAFKL